MKNVKQSGEKKPENATRIAAKFVDRIGPLKKIKLFKIKSKGSIFY